MNQAYLSRRQALSTGVAMAALTAAPSAWAQAGTAQGSPRTFDLVLERRTVNITGRPHPAMAINGTIPGPVLRFREGERGVSAEESLEEFARIARVIRGLGRDLG